MTTATLGMSAMPRVKSPCQTAVADPGTDSAVGIPMRDSDAMVPVKTSARQLRVFNIVRACESLPEAHAEPITPVATATTGEINCGELISARFYRGKRCVE